MRKLTVTILLLLTFLAGKAQQKDFIDQPYIDVNGNADTSITPDEIYIRITVSESDTKNKTSVEDLEVKMVNTLKALDVNTAKDLTTNDISSNFKYYLLKGKGILKTKVYILKVRDAVTATKVISQLEDLGISNTSIERVDYSDIDNLQNIMKSKAVENAKMSAIALTKPLNQTVGAAIYISGTLNSNPYSQLQGRVAGISLRGYANDSLQEADLPKIEFEKIKVIAAVNVKFVLK